ncbi:P-type DNA transfer ATPase VirB11 [Parashewanella spongiae]|uniref:Type IV secretion system protein n=1 Tax=Parashewanella spongiae TaxID=342950 RepID=A0A3A6TLT3_9GAMM|nr:P-type DNA transfer ATPase VirB11 [Parashewanella spongiae]MCL1078420.1 P-type DNA transfer ATPase VirB11 [Parashewanella spongiae]RJY13301.1 P-type DNA transfer ATPase VirB11 [Parashewanella spongiae]
MTCNLLITNSAKTDFKTIEHCRAVALLEHLKVLTPYIEQDGVTELVINKPNELMTESNQGWLQYQNEKITIDYCQRLAKLIATYSGQKLDGSHPILSATLPSGERVQIAIPPVTLIGQISFTIRKPASVNLTLDDYHQQGYFRSISIETEQPLECQLTHLYGNNKIATFLKLAIEQRKNIIVSGATGSGKTTFFRSLLQQVPQSERLISIENVDELQLYRTHPNSVSLFYSAGNQGVAPVTQKQLLESSLRMKPDRVFLAELIRGDEAFYFLRNINSGHPGSITTMHAGSPKLAMEQLVLLLKESQAGSTLSKADIKQLINLCVDVIVQLQNVNGRRFVTEVYYRG